MAKILTFVGYTALMWFVSDYWFRPIEHLPDATLYQVYWMLTSVLALGLVLLTFHWFFWKANKISLPRIFGALICIAGICAGFVFFVPDYHGSSGYTSAYDLAHRASFVLTLIVGLLVLTMTSAATKEK